MTSEKNDFANFLQNKQRNVRLSSNSIIVSDVMKVQNAGLNLFSVWYGVKQIKFIFADKGNSGITEQSLRHDVLFITASSSRFFNKTDLEQYL